MQKNYLLLRLMAFVGALQCSLSVSAQHHETMGDPYLPPVVTATPNISPAFHFSGPNVFITQVNVNADGNNILDDAANEPSIAVNPKDPSRMAIGWRQFDNIGSNFRQAGFGYTTDAGQHWTFPGVIEPTVFRSDPVLASDADGRFYYNSLTLNSGSGYNCDVFRATGDGTWDAGVYAVGGDKAWMTIDQTAGDGAGFLYSNWTSAYSDCPNSSNYTRSTDKGESYEYCLSFAPDVYWGTNAVGPDGTLYLCGNGGTVLRSHNAQNVAEAVVWEEVAFANLNYGNPSWPGETPNPVGIIGQCYIDVNHATGPLYNQVYVLQSVQQDGVNDPRDVMFSRSIDGAQTFEPAVKINDDEGSPEWQWFGTMSVAPTGRIDVAWLDTRDNPGTLLSSLYYSYSTDGGVTWSANERLSPEFDPHIGWPGQNKIGDYFHMVSDSSGAHLAWAATFNGEQDVYYAHITLPSSATHTPGLTPAFRLYPSAPNPFSEQTTLPYEIKEAGHVQVVVFNQLGIPVRILADQTQVEGTYQLTWDGRGDAGQALASGVYYCRLSVDGRAQFGKIGLTR